MDDLRGRADQLVRRRAHTVRARLLFNDAGELVDFESDDRSRASPDGKTFTPERWSTPLRPYKRFGTRYLSSGGDAVTHAPDGAFAYGEFELQSIEYNLSARARGSHRRDK